MIPAYVLSKDAEECADQTDDQQQSDAGNGLPVLLLHQEEQAEGQSQRDQLGQDAIRMLWITMGLSPFSMTVATVVPP